MVTTCPVFFSTVMRPLTTGTVSLVAAAISAGERALSLSASVTRSVAVGYESFGFAVHYERFAIWCAVG